MNRMKTIAFAVAAMMMLVGGLVVLNSTEDSDAAAGSAGSFNVYIYTEEDDIGSWTHHNVQAYNAMLAIMGCPEYSTNTATVNQRYDYPYEYLGETYYNIDDTYGTITEFMGISNDTVTGSAWNMLVLTKLSDEQTFSWKLGDTATGWYKPFEDYAARMPEYGTANIALYYGAPNDSSTIASDLDSYISGNIDRSAIDLTQIVKTSGSVFEHKFYIMRVLNGYEPTVAPNTYATDWNYQSIQVLPSSFLSSALRVVGYGSDAMLALIDATGSANTIFESTTNPAPGFETYGWMVSMFGLGTFYNDYLDLYTYWQIYSQYTIFGDSNNVSAKLVLGAYSALTNAPQTDGSFALIFQNYTP